MRNSELCLALNLLLVLFNVCTSLTVQLIPSKSKTFKPPNSFTISCNVTYDGGEPTIKWKKNDNDVSSIKELHGRVKVTWDKQKYLTTLTVEKTHEHDAGNYSCVALDPATGSEIARQEVGTAMYVAVDVPNNVNVIEEEKLRIECKLIGNAQIHWIFKEEIYNETRDRVILSNFSYNGNDYENGVFVLDKVENGDRGVVTCVGVEILTRENATSECMVRVKDKYAALWPFLGICAEVIVLCAVIIIYEKKRNKTELEESDTDQSPDQKPNADHGKDANLRHRQ